MQRSWDLSVGHCQQARLDTNSFAQAIGINATLCGVLHDTASDVVSLPPGSHGSPLHYHENITETFAVLSGSLEMELGAKGNIQVLQPREIIYVPAGMQHSFRKTSQDWVRFTSEALPPRKFEQFICSMYGLAIDGKVNPQGMPLNPLHLALLIEKADLVLVGQPVFVQKLLVGCLSRLAHLLGVERSLVKYWS